MASCLQCRHATQTLVEPGKALMQLVCVLSGNDCGAGCAQFTQRTEPMEDPRGKTYSAAWMALCEARHVCRLALHRKQAEYLAGLRLRRGDDAIKDLERRARAEWRRRAEWMTPDELEWARYV